MKKIRDYQQFFKKKIAAINIFSKKKFTVINIRGYQHSQLSTLAAISSRLLISRLLFSRLLINVNPKSFRGIMSENPQNIKILTKNVFETHPLISP